MHIPSKASYAAPNIAVNCGKKRSAAEELIGYTDCVGQAISPNGVKHTIVGVLQDDENNLTRVFSSGSMLAYVSYNALMRLSSAVTRDPGWKKAGNWGTIRLQRLERHRLFGK